MLAAPGCPLEETVRGARKIAGWHGLLAFPWGIVPAPALNGCRAAVPLCIACNDMTGFTDSTNTYKVF